MKRIVILGSTGSIGTQTLDVIEKHRDDFEVKALTCGRNIELFREQLRKFKPSFAVTELESDAAKLKEEFKDIEFSYGPEGLIEAVDAPSDLVVNALMGMRGLPPTYRACENGVDIAFANKETLVAGGEIIIPLAKKNNVKLLPVDSEHSAIFQSLEGNRERKVKKILLTASGGPFRGFTREELKNVTLEKALKHPKWNMGRKITIDSATMMNKGLEVIEAKWLFDVEAKDIEIVVHPESVLHSAVEFTDNSVIGQMGVPDMRIPISLALGYPDRLESGAKELNLFEIGKLTFMKPDREVFGCIDIAYDAIEKGNIFPAVMNGANEVLVDLFLNEKIGFLDIERILKEVLSNTKPIKEMTLEGILEADRKAREMALDLAQAL